MIRDTVLLDFETDGLNFQTVNPIQGHWPVTVTAIRYNEQSDELARRIGQNLPETCIVCRGPCCRFAVLPKPID